MTPRATDGPLSVSPENPRWFRTASGRAVFLTGSHTWNNLVDMGPKGRVVPFDWDAYLDFLVAQGHNFIRLWAYDSLATWNPADEVLTTPWLRIGPGNAWDGKPKLDLSRLDDAYFERLRSRVQRAGSRGIYVSIMLFEAWSNFPQNETPLAAHFFAGGNNVNGIDILSQPFHGVHAGWVTLRDPAALAAQKAYAARVVEAVHDLDNVLYEICNEGGPTSHDWQDHLTAYLRALETARGVRHPIGQTGGMGTLNRRLHRSAADWVSPDASGLDGAAFGYRTGHYAWGEGPGEAADRPLLLDTDHIWGVGGDFVWAWKSFCRGYNLLYMDPWTDQPSGFFRHPRWPAASDAVLRRELGAIRAVSERIDLGAAIPDRRAASSGFCLAVPGEAYVAFAAAAGPMTLDLPGGQWAIEWRDPIAGRTYPADAAHSLRAGTAEFAPPFVGPGVLLVTRASLA